ncbi:transglutaminase domain-containing protein [Wocania ichthyoenteri]|uniref:transglutaminase domain-containing protein n=1 Tax=Wocania ichthyoenteri TaxID=1230531 RepID=UPI00053E3786|nr:transglutaminase domain-containing protein [Wocania ichthyoenteri]
MKNVITTLAILFICQISIAQDYKFGKVSKEELQEKYNPLDSSASATYLYKYRKTFFEHQKEKGFQLITEVHERVKIYNKEGFDYATKAINLYKSGSHQENARGLKAYTYNLVDGTIEDTKLKKDGIFKTEKSKYHNETKFTMPNIKEGSVVEYEYKIISPFYSNVDEFRLQHAIPIKKLEAQFQAPEYYNFKVNMKGFLQVIPKIENKRDKLQYKNKVPISENKALDASTHYRSGEIEFTKIVSSYSLENIPALKEEPYVNNINNYRSSVKYELSYVKMPQSTIEYYSTTWEDVVKTIYKSSSFGAELDKSGYYEDDIDALISAVSDPKARVALIFDFVKSRVKWNTYYGKYTSGGVRKAYKEQVGNVAEINLMLTSMLRYAGLEANPVLVSTRQNGIPLFPTREGYNYVVSCVELPTGHVLLDATNKYGSPNILPYRTLNWEGRIIKKDGTSSLINLYPSENSKTSILMMADLSEEGDLEGNFRSVKTNHKALSYRERYNNANEDDFLEQLENKHDGLEISDFKVANAVELSKPVMESYKFFKESQADIIGDKIYFSPLFFLRTKENPFKLEKREFPVDFGYPSSSTYRITINLPEGYKVESIPEGTALVLPDDLGMFKYILSQKGSTIQLLIDAKMNTSIISPLYYETLKAYFKQLIEKENEQIVLTKV